MYPPQPATATTIPGGHVEKLGRKPKKFTIRARAYLRAPCPFLPGSAAKLLVQTARANAGLPLFVAGDAVFGERMGYQPRIAGVGQRLGIVAAIIEEGPGGARRVIPDAPHQRLPARVQQRTPRAAA